MKNKVIPIVCIFLLVFNILITFSYGFSDEENAKVAEVSSKMLSDVKNNTNMVPTYNCFTIFGAIDCFFDGTACKYVLFFTNCQTWKVYLNNDVMSFYSHGGSEQQLEVFYFDNYFNYVGHRTFSAGFGQYVTHTDVSSYFKADNITIYKDNSKSEVVEPFFHFPSVLVQVMGVELTEKRTIREILGVLPLILVVVVSFLGLRKALRMLLSFLRRS